MLIRRLDKLGARSVHEACSGWLGDRVRQEVTGTWEAGGS